MTLWLNKHDHSVLDLIKYIQSRNLKVHVTYMDDRQVPILFTRLGSFEGESSIRRAALMLSAQESST